MKMLKNVDQIHFGSRCHRPCLPIWSVLEPYFKVQVHYQLLYFFNPSTFSTGSTSQWFYVGFDPWKPVNGSLNPIDSPYKKAWRFELGKGRTNQGSSLVYRGEEIFTTIRPEIITPNITLIDVEVESTTAGRQWTARTDPRTAPSTRVPMGREDSEPSGRFGNFRGQSFETMKEVPRTSTLSSTTSTSSYRTSYRPSSTTRMTPTSTKRQEDFDQGKKYL